MSEHPRFNHVAMSVPAAMLDEAGLEQLLGFYQDVFGWTEMPTMTKPGRQLVLQAYSYDQFVFIIAEDEPMACPRMDHFGMSVDTKAEFDTFLQRARERAESDDRVDLVDASVEDYGFLRLHSFYVGFLLPLMIEVQHWDWDKEAAPARR
jgi:hypothetical protein